MEETFYSPADERIAHEKAKLTEVKAKAYDTIIAAFRKGGKKGGKVKSEKKTLAARANAKNPRKRKPHPLTPVPSPLN